MKHTKQTAGSKGGRVTVQRHGREHMQQIGRKGAATTWSRYTLKPVNQSQYAMVEKTTGIIKAIF